MTRTFIPDPAGDLKTVAPNGVVKVSGLEIKESNLDTFAGPYNWQDECPTGECMMSTFGIGERQLKGKMRNGG